MRAEATAVNALDATVVIGLCSRFKTKRFLSLLKRPLARKEQIGIVEQGGLSAQEDLPLYAIQIVVGQVNFKQHW